MNIITKQISELKPYKNNPKIHTDSQIDKIAKSIRTQDGISYAVGSLPDINNDDSIGFGD